MNYTNHKNTILKKNNEIYNDLKSHKEFCLDERRRIHEDFKFNNQVMFAK